MSGISERQGASAQAVALYLRVLGGDLGAAHLWFDAHVLDRYREKSGWRVMRTNTVGRLRSPEGWQLDFGIVDVDGALHTTARELSERLPASERQHWAEHVILPAASRNFLAMRMAPGSCIDDGDLRDWPA
ncbi:MAG: hypothetical protein JO352_10965 [Chloroflexi bacterium]|nr:hypothetical protein [Chloroflexota bacterium]